MLQSDWLRYSLFVNRYRVAASNATRPSFSKIIQCLFLVFRNNEHKFVFTKTIRLFVLNLYEVIEKLVPVGLIFVIKSDHRNFELVM